MFKDNYTLLIERLDQFIRKFYINQLIRGSLYTVAIVLGIFLVFNLLEYYFYFGTGIRKFMWYSLLATAAFALIQWIFQPILHYFRLGKVISHEQAAGIIGNHFYDVKDKLLNILQLKKLSYSTAQAELIHASINQKTEQLRPVPFQAAIDLQQNRKYLKYALPPFLLFLGILFIAPKIIKDGSKRLINNNQVFEKEAPFKFVVDNNQLQVLQYEDYQLNVKIEGSALPNEVFIGMEGVQYRLKKEANDLFTYQFSKVAQNTKFQLFGGGFSSKEYELSVLAKPNIAGFSVKLDYPEYVGKKDETLNNIGDLVVPAGTQIQWEVNTQHTDNVQYKFGEAPIQEAKRVGEDFFVIHKQAFQDERYRVTILNKNVPKGDSIWYTLSVVPDLYPTITANRFVDSTNEKLQFFVGDVSDDYGIRSLIFNYHIKSPEGKIKAQQTSRLTTPEGKQGMYKYTFDASLLQINPGDEVTYYFEVTDNDAVRGGKSTRTQLMSYRMPTKEEFEQKAEQNNEEIKKDLLDALKETKKIQDEIQKLKEKMLQQKEPDWQTKKELEKLLNRQKELNQQIDEAKKNFDENQKNQSEFQKPDEKLMQKQEQLQKIFDQLQNEEMKKLMEEIQELLKKMEKQETLDKLEKFEMNNEEMNLQMDRMLELFKNLELEQKINQTTEKLEELAKKQEELSKETEKNDKPQDELEKKQEDIKKEFDKVKEDLKDIEKKNEELENKKETGIDKEDQKEVDQEMQKSEEELDKKQNSKASKSQKKAASKMKDMANKMKQSQQKQEMEEMEEDMKALRQLLENLVELSFSQEKLMNNFTSTPTSTPAYTKLIQHQHKLKGDFQLIQDSLQALSKRNGQIEAFVTEKITEINSQFRQNLEKLEEIRSPNGYYTLQNQEQPASHQQKIMKNVNDLALMLNETMESMQQQMGEQMPGNQSCNKPGGKKPKPGSQGKPSDKMSKGQQELNKDLKKMKDGMKGGSPGKSGAEAKQFAEMAARQAALRKALRELQKENQQKGQGNKQLEEILEQMDKVETDLVNKQLNSETLKRLDEIEVKLLESERAEREREYDEKRKGETAKDYERKMPPSLQEYLKKRESEIEFYKTVSPNLKPFYKNLVEEYQKTLKKG